MQSDQMRSRICFISAPLGFDTEPLRNTLKRHAVAWIDPSRFEPGSLIQESLRDAIKDADFVCAVIPRNREYSNVLFEIGVAAGLGCPVVAFVDPKVEILFDINASLYVSADLSQTAAIDFQLDAFLRRPRKRPSVHPSPHKVKAKLKSPDTTRVLALLKSLRRRPDNAAEIVREFESALAKLLMQNGFEVSMRPAQEHKGADMAVWLDGVEPYVRNPILVDVKVRLPLEDSQAVRRLHRHVLDSAAGMGILLYALGGMHRRPDHELADVLVMSVTTLVEELSAGTLQDRILAHRNRLIHSGS